MELDYYIGEKRVSWKTMTLKEFTDAYTPKGWKDVFEAAREDVFPVMSVKLAKFAKKNTIYPEMQDLFNALESVPPEKVMIVIIGQDPYFNPGEATGHSFSVPEGITVPPSLRNIYKELTKEGYSGYKNRKTGDLSAWVEKGVFLYNACLTVNKGSAGSHGNMWVEFSDMVINYLSQQEHIAWILLGKKAQAYKTKLDKDSHGIFCAGHPSPNNLSGGFLDSDVFIDAERYLKKHGREFTWNLE